MSMMKFFINNIFSKLNSGQRDCVLLLDEVYVKPMFAYHGGQLFGKPVNDSSSIAKTVLAFMIVCCYGGPKFLVKMLPISNLDSDFLFDQTTMLINKIRGANGNIIAIINDNNCKSSIFQEI